MVFQLNGKNSNFSQTAWFRAQWEMLISCCLLHLFCPVLKLWKGSYCVQIFMTRCHVTVKWSAQTLSLRLWYLFQEDISKLRRKIEKAKKPAEKISNGDDILNEEISEYKVGFCETCHTGTVIRPRFQHWSFLLEQDCLLLFCVKIFLHYFIQGNVTYLWLT